MSLLDAEDPELEYFEKGLSFEESCKLNLISAYVGLENLLSFRCFHGQKLVLKNTRLIESGISVFVRVWELPSPFSEVNANGFEELFELFGAEVACGLGKFYPLSPVVRIPNFFSFQESSLEIVVNAVFCLFPAFFVHLWDNLPHAIAERVEEGSPVEVVLIQGAVFSDFHDLDRVLSIPHFRNVGFESVGFHVPALLCYFEEHAERGSMTYLVRRILFAPFRIGVSSMHLMVSPLRMSRFLASVILAVLPAILIPLTVRLIISGRVAHPSGVFSRMSLMIASVWLPWCFSAPKSVFSMLFMGLGLWVKKRPYTLRILAVVFLLSFPPMCKIEAHSTIREKIRFSRFSSSSIVRFVVNTVRFSLDFARSLSQ